MKRYHSKPKRVPVYEISAMECDVCHRIFDVKEDMLEIQEFHHIDFIGGYGSIFGDESNVRCDICQHCIKELLVDHIRLNEDECDET